MNKMKHYRRFMLLLAMLSAVTFANAQDNPQKYCLPSVYKITKVEVLDTAQYQVTYAMGFKNSKSQTEYYKDIRIVQIGSKYIKDYSRNLYEYDSLYTEKSKFGKPSKGPQKPVFAFNIIRNTQSNQNNISYRMFGSLGTMTYEEDAKPLEWELTDETLTILGYSCHKAMVSFAGRKYIAWYSMNLPLSAGPYKFSGLPGLILKVEESLGMYVWEAIGIEKSQRQIVRNTYERQVNTKKDKALKTIGRMFAGPITMQLSTGTMMATVKNGKLVDLTEKDDKPIPYDPLEIE